MINCIGLSQWLGSNVPSNNILDDSWNLKVNEIEMSPVTGVASEENTFTLAKVSNNPSFNLAFVMNEIKYNISIFNDTYEYPIIGAMLRDYVFITENPLELPITIEITHMK